MKKAIYFGVLLLSAIALISCQKAALKKTPGGMPYELFSDAKQPQVKMGGFLKLAISQSINDSVVFTNQGKIPNYIPVLNQTAPYDLSEIWSQLRLGDSVIATQMMDTFMNRNPGSVPPPFKKGDRIITTVKVLGIFDNDSLQKIDAEKELGAFKAKEVSEVKAFVKKSGVNAQRTSNGIYVQVLTPGNGNPIDSGKYVSVKYTGMTFDGKVFDSNVDSTFNHMEPLNFTVGAGQMIPGFDEGVRLLRAGGKGVLFIPSMQGYGPAGSGSIKGYAHLKFEIEVLSVADKAPASGNTP
jgi:FKBP-type peptidyl-prolyl cis-trans isomerase